MADYRDAILCKNGENLLKLAVAGEALIGFTSVKTSSAKYDVSQLKSLTEVDDIKQTSALIAKTKDSPNTVSLYAAFTNDKITEGYYVRNFCIYAKDPEDEENEILYAIISADETNVPATFMPSYSNRGTSGIEFACEIVVANSEDVTIQLDTSIGVPTDVFNTFVDGINAEMKKVNEAIEILSNKSSIIEKGIVLPETGWKTGAAVGTYYYDASIEGITEDMLPYAQIVPQSEDETAAKACGLKTRITSMENVVRFYADEMPSEEINVRVFLVDSSSEISGGGGGSSTGYVLPVATKTRLGGVKVGDRINVAYDGTISATGEIASEYRADTGEVKEMLDEIFGGK